MSETFVNKVAESGLVTLDLETWFPKDPIKVFDLKEYLFMGLILKEKDFRAALQTTEWESFRDTQVAITCSADAIIPMWAYMLVASYLEPVAAGFVFGDEEKLKQSLLLRNLEAINGAEYQDQRVVVKGCGDIAIPETAYVEITRKLRPHVKSIMYGEPCSTVPIFKRK
jgi:hypothetical protein